MTWEEVCADPYLQGLPYKIELNKWGNIEMSPARNRHGEYQLRIGHLLELKMSGGIAQTECGVRTSENVKVPDVVWVSLSHRRATPHEFAYEVAPEICVEIMSPSNYLEEQMHKGKLYLDAGAVEFWLCDERGSVRFFDTAGTLEHSHLCPEFAAQIELPE